MYRDDAAFYRAALLLGLVRGHDVVSWADEVIANDPSAAAGFVEIATTHPDDLTRLRQALFGLGGDKESAAVVRRLIGLVQKHLESGGRSLQDTMTVLKQLRAFVAVDASLNEQLKTLGVDVFMAVAGSPERRAAEQRVRDWLRRYE